ncbi:MAG: heavy-metal-associated domain-containing protein [Bacteroidetes bacterium]|nr:heavy-metal-associated domain-containing protein [Bacteroidota bacterium]
MSNVLITIENLKCNGCAATIKKGLYKFDEIESVNVDIEKSSVEIYFNGDQNNIDSYKLKLQNMGYPETGSNNTFSIAKSYVSCAVGKISK